MARLQRPLRPIMITYQCDECQKGEMVHNRLVPLVEELESQKFRHVCPECKNEQSLDQVYPSLEYADDGGSIDLTKWPERKYIIKS